MNTYVGEYGTGIFTQTGGTNSFDSSVASTYLYIGYRSGSTGIYNFTEGTLYITNGAKRVSVKMANLAGSVGTFNFGNATSTGTFVEGGGGSSFYIGHVDGSSGTLRGWGLLDLGGWLYSSGNIIADGYGTDRDLDLTPLGKYVSSKTPAVSKGNYAQNHGQLIIDGYSLIYNTTTSQAWGTDPDKTTLDVVNSVLFEFVDKTGGNSLLLGKLKATDRDDVDLGSMIDVIGLWEFSNANLGTGSATVTFRYDDVAAAGASYTDMSFLRIMQDVGGTWTDITGSINTTDKTITTKAGLTSLGSFALGRFPAGTVILVQ